MRDIRNDLRERLASLDGQQYEVLAQYQEDKRRIDAEREAAVLRIERERAALKQMLDIEERRAQATPLASAAPPVAPLADFLITNISQIGPMGKEELRAVVEQAGYDSGRALHTTLMNITKAGRLCHAADGRYALPATDPVLFTSKDWEGASMKN